MQGSKNDIHYLRSMSCSDILNSLNTTIEILNGCIVIQEDIKYIGNLNSFQTKIIDESGFLLRQIDNEWRILIIDLHKLFCDKENYSIVKLLNVLLQEYKTIVWVDDISKQDMITYKTSLEEDNYLQAIKKLKILRSKFVAHLDKGRTNYDSFIAIEDINLLIDYGIETLNMLYKCLTGNEFLFNVFNSSSLAGHIQFIEEKYNA